MSLVKGGFISRNKKKATFVKVAFLHSTEKPYPVRSTARKPRPYVDRDCVL